MTILRFSLGLLFLSLVSTVSLSAHARGESYVGIEMEGETLLGVVEFSLEDLRNRFDLGTDFMTDPIAKIEETAPPVQAYIREHMEIAAGGKAYPLEFGRTRMIGSRGDGFALYYFTVEFEEAPAALDLRIEFLYDFDRFHRNLVLWTEPGSNPTGEYIEGSVAMVFGPSTSEQTLDLNNIPSIREPADMVVEGVWHIWIGLDHILFILALLLPTVLVWKNEERRWMPVEGFGKAFLKILKIVTIFTVAHSLTLGLAAFDYIRLSSRLVESVIALSIVLVAFGNIIGGNLKSSVMIIFVLGLFHGLGFASVMGELPFRMADNLALKSVLLFNVGVELGQIAIVVALFPLLFFLRKSENYPLVVVRGASVVLALVAGYWFVERAFELA